MRVWIGLIVVACVACKKKPDSAPAVGSGAGSGSEAPLVAGDAAPVAIDAAADAIAIDGAVAAVVDAGPPPAPFCLDKEEDEDLGYKQLASDGKTLSFCLRQEERTPKCATLDLAAGTFTTISAPADLEVEKPGPITAKKVDTSTLELPKGHEWQTDTSPDGKTIAAVTDLEGQLFIVDAETKKVRKVVKWGADGGCMEAPSFIGDNIYVQYNVCAGPGATGWIVSPEGKKLGSLKYINPTGQFFPVGGTRYAFEDFNGSGFEIVDGKSGKSVKQIEIKLPMECADCMQFRTGNLGLVQVPGGKLVQFMAKIAVVDPAAGKVEKLIPWPLCKAK